MAVYAVVPVKHLDASKKRLSSVLTPKDRRNLTLVMLEDVLSAIKASTVQKTIVVGSDIAVRRLAEKFLAFYIDEETTGLNLAVLNSIDWCMREGADSVLVLPADVPLISPKDINTIIALGNYKEPIVVLSPSNNGGTNALFQKPPQVIIAQFGPRSFDKHMKQARSKGISLKLHYSSSVALDIDSEQDLKRLLETQNNTRSKQFLAQVLPTKNSL
ncbi:MAG TPA: 2-phospho-L-lactate guanylyltransferase [Candidatus Acidoferrum sp.]|nr:2-phospho-L-lactate guanylyltransferase [Candidatus Acidoferrum sp.]